MTFEEAHAFWLSRFDELREKQRKIHEDWSHVNQHSKECKELLEELNYCNAELFRLKDVRATYERRLAKAN